MSKILLITFNGFINIDHIYLTLRDRSPDFEPKTRAMIGGFADVL